MSLQFECLNGNLAQEWFNDLKEYFNGLLKPLSKIKLGEVLGCKGDPVASFEALNYITFWIYALYLTSVVVVSWIATGLNPFGVVSFAFSTGMQLFLIFLGCSLQWFGVVKKYGCCWCIFCCFQGSLVLFIIGILNVVWGVQALIDAMRMVPFLAKLVSFWPDPTNTQYSVSQSSLYYIVVVFCMARAVTQIYLGANAIKMFNAQGGMKRGVDMESGSEFESSSNEESVQ